MHQCFEIYSIFETYARFIEVNQSLPFLLCIVFVHDLSRNLLLVFISGADKHF